MHRITSMCRRTLGALAFFCVGLAVAGPVSDQAATAQVPVHWMDPARAGDTMHRLCWELIPSLEGICTSDVTSDPAAPLVS